VSQDVVRDIVKVIFALAMLILLWRAVNIYRITNKERKTIQWKASKAAHEAWMALRIQDKRMYLAELDSLKAELEAKEEVIKKQQEEIDRWHAIGQAALTGKGGRIK